jgi:wobble nucleotide-excising tRNase
MAERIEAKRGGGVGHYKIVRPDGATANASLSEGEKTFVTFCYAVKRRSNHPPTISRNSRGVTTRAEP